jgi:hemoglobin
MTARYDISEEGLNQVVTAFYARIRQDAELGPIFNDAIRDWPEHLEKLTDFWSSVMLTSGRYKGSPMAAHLKHASAIQPAMFDRWLELWRETAREMPDEDHSAAVIAKAERIAESLQLGLFFKLPPERSAAAA